MGETINSRVLQARIKRLEAALISYRTALWSVSGPEAALLCRQLDAKFSELIYQLGPPKEQQKPKGKTNG